MEAKTETPVKPKKSNKELMEDYEVMHNIIMSFVDKHWEVISGFRTYVTRGNPEKTFRNDVRVILDGKKVEELYK